MDRTCRPLKHFLLPIYVTSLLILIFVLSPALSCGEPGAPKMIRVVMDNNYPPFAFLDNTGKLQGILVDQWTLWEKKTGIKAELTGMDWSVAQEQMEDGRFDVIDTIFFNERREKIYDFTKPYQKIEVPIFFHRNISGISGVQSLTGFDVAVKAGDAAIDYLQKHGIARFREFQSYADIIEAAKGQKVVVFIVDKPSALYFLYKAGIFDQFHYSSPLYTGELHRAVKKGNTALLKTVEDGFAGISKKEYSEIEKKWYGTQEFPKEYIFYGIVAAITIAFILLGLMAWNSALRRAVRIKTTVLEKEIELSEARAEALRESEERFGLFLKYCPILVFLKDRDNRALALSHSFEEFLGRSTDDILGKTSEELFPPDMAQKIRNDDERVFRSGEPEVIEEEYEGRQYITYKFPLFRPDTPPLLGGFTIDITGRKRAEEALRKSEQQYKDVVNNASSIILRWDTKGNVLFMNPFGLDFFGYSEEEIVGRNVANTIVPEIESQTSRNLVELMGQIQQDPDGFKDNENENIKKSGERVWVSWRNSAVFNDKGELIEILSIGNDVTEKRNLESQLLNAQKMEAIGTLAGGIAHDFNNLLMGIMGYTSFMLITTDPSHPNYEKLKSIEEQIRNGAELTRQLLGFARRGKYEVKPTGLNDLIERSSDMFGHTKKEIAIHKKLQKDLHTVEVDRGQIEQVLMNLFVNAWQAMPGGGELYIETMNIVMDDNRIVPRGGRYVKISVADTGIGMNQNIKERIFDPFFTTKEFGTGSGLGLASAYGIVKNHQGAITVESEPGKGTRFDIYLPASEKEIVHEKPPVEEIAGGSETILLVDDQPVVAITSKEMLEALGYTVLVAESGMEALEMFGSHRKEIGLVILDMIMPGLSGSETYDRLKEMDSGIRVILSSGYSIEGQAAEILEKGCNAFIQKPFTINELSAKVREVLGSG